MKINAEDLEKARALMPGLFRFNNEMPFSQAVLALNEQELFIYDDHAPDAIQGEANDELVYKVKVRIPLNTIETVVDEKIVNQPELAGLDRLSILLAGSPETYFFYYFNEDKKTSNNFIAGLKHYKVAVQSRKIKLTA